MRIRLAEDDDQVIDLPDPRPVASSHRAPELVGEHDVRLSLSPDAPTYFSAVPVPD